MELYVQSFTDSERWCVMDGIYAFRRISNCGRDGWWWKRLSCLSMGAMRRRKIIMDGWMDRIPSSIWLSMRNGLFVVFVEIDFLPCVEKGSRTWVGVSLLVLNAHPFRRISHKTLPLMNSILIPHSKQTCYRLAISLSENWLYDAFLMASPSSLAQRNAWNVEADSACPPCIGCTRCIHPCMHWSSQMKHSINFHYISSSILHLNTSELSFWTPHGF